MKSLPRSILGWMIQQRIFKKVIKHNGQGNQQGNIVLPNGVSNLLYGIYGCSQKYFPKLVANLGQETDKEHIAFP